MSTAGHSTGRVTRGDGRPTVERGAYEAGACAVRS